MMDKNKVSRKYLKKIAWILVFSVLHTTLLAQIVIQSSDMPGPGDTVRISTGINTNIADYTQTGEDYLWDFSQLMPIAQNVDTFVTPSQTPFLYQFFFAPYSNLANKYMQDVLLPEFELTDVYYYYKNTSSQFSNIGYAATVTGIPLPLKFGEPDVLYRFPLNYGDTDSSASHVIYDFPNLLYLLVDRSRKNEVDGWGTLITPFGTFDVLRVKSEVHEFDSIYIDSLQIGVPVNRNFTEYKWLAKGQKEPVLQITSDITGGLLVVYRDSVRTNLDAVDDHLLNRQTVAVYPNPASSVFFVSFNLLQPSRVELSVYDATGRQLYREQITDAKMGFNTITLNTGSLALADGMYVIKLRAGNQLVTKKIIIKS